MIWIDLVMVVRVFARAEECCSTAGVGVEVERAKRQCKWQKRASRELVTSAKACAAKTLCGPCFVHMVCSIDDTRDDQLKVYA